MIIGSVWSIHNDANVYPNPTAFMPERFLGNKDLPHFTFGFGRRACPGLHHAYSSLLLFMAATLWGFEILPGKDASGNEVVMDVSPTAFTEGGEAS
jgi:cytochrome P450